MKDHQKAFPSVLQYFPEDTNYHEDQGMDLRDYFAAKALPLANDTVQANPEGWYGVAKVAYAIADAMLKARED